MAVYSREDIFDGAVVAALINDNFDIFVMQWSYCQYVIDKKIDMYVSTYACSVSTDISVQKLVMHGFW